MAEYEVIKVGMELSKEAKEHLLARGWSVQGNVLVHTGTQYPVSLAGKTNYIPLHYDNTEWIVVTPHPLDVWDQYGWVLRVMSESEMNKWVAEHGDR